jgi:simple sugar transport system permease protein
MTIDLATALAASAVAMAIPLLYAALGELLSEKAGVVNIGLEGFLLLGAFTAFAVANASGSASAAIVATLLVGAVVGAGFAFLVVRCSANQIVVGTALNLFAAGATGVLYRATFGVTGSVLTVRGSPHVALPLLHRIPIAGEALFHQTPLAYACLALVPACAFLLMRTRVGLRLRMAGENPRAAITQGVHVERVRTLAVIACGILSSAGGAYLALDYTHTFVEGMSAGRGFIALAIVIVGRRWASGILGAAMLFGLAIALQFHFQALAFEIPFQFFLILPYAATLALLALSAGDTNAPAGLGK